jgi:hypothetical protein
MQMSAADQRLYPRTATYLKNDLPPAARIPAIIHAMRTVGQVSRAALTRALSWGQGPSIKVAPLIGRYGEFTPGVGSHEIRVAATLVASVEAGRGVLVARAGNVSLLGVTLLHELVHWGDDQDGVDRPGEEGEEFERLVYGRVIG